MVSRLSSHENYRSTHERLDINDAIVAEQVTTLVDEACEAVVAYSAGAARKCDRSNRPSSLDGFF